MNDPNAYYNDLLVKGYSEQEAFVYTKKHYPEFQPPVVVQKPQVSMQEPSALLHGVLLPPKIEATNPLSTQHSHPQSAIENVQQFQQPILMYPAKQGNHGKTVAIVVGIIVFAVAAIVVLAGVLYVWASDLAAHNNGEEIEGTWYNPEDTISFYPNGTVSESTETITQWRTDSNDLYFTFHIDGEDIEIRSIYDIVLDDQGDSLLFMAFYQIDTESGTQTDEIDEGSCVNYSSSISGTENEHFEERRAVFPSWCNPDYSNRSTPIVS